MGTPLHWLKESGLSEPSGSKFTSENDKICNIA